VFTAGLIICIIAHIHVWEPVSPLISLKKREDVLQEEWYKIPLETVHNFYESVARRKGCTEGRSWSSSMLIKKRVQCL
jgi:hypothetical protein